MEVLAIPWEALDIQTKRIFSCWEGTWWHLSFATDISHSRILTIIQKKTCRETGKYVYKERQRGAQNSLCIILRRVRDSRETYFNWTSSCSINFTVYLPSRENNAFHSMLSWFCKFPSAVTPWLVHVGTFSPGLYWCFLCRCLGLIVAVGMGGISPGNYKWSTVKLLVMCEATPFCWILYLILFCFILCVF